VLPAMPLLMSSTARNLYKKINLILQVIYHISPWMNPGTVNPPDPNVISSTLSFELLDAVVGLACSSMVILYRETFLLSSRTMFEVRNAFHISR